MKYVYDLKLQRPLELSHEMARNDVDKDYFEYDKDWQYSGQVVEITKSSYDVLVKSFNVFFSGGLTELKPIYFETLQSICAELKKYGI